jgi:phosphate transport system substrate-binding protein
MKRIGALAALLLFPLVALGTGVQPAHAATQIDGAGSTWSQIAVDQWRADVARNGLSVNFQGVGSSAGRQFYIQSQVDFAISEIPFQPASYDRTGAKLYDEVAAAAKRPYAYMPIVAGGTSLMYHLDVGGRRITDLRLSGTTIAKIFTGAITNWADPAIAADDGRHFPSLSITPVVRSDGSGTSAQFSAYMASMFPSIWNPFCSKALNLPSPCPATSLYPYFRNSRAQSGSDGVANFVAEPFNNGAISYVEYGYALNRSFPVVSVLNQAGYFVQPTAENVAVALGRARINTDRTQNLHDVYTNPDPRAYPVSSYSYMIVPTSTTAPFTADKGATLGRFILYFLCTGQQKAKQLGYSPLPPNLVQFGFDAEKLIPGAPAPPPLSQCANPTITGGFTTANAPPPPASAKFGSPRSSADGSPSARRYAVAPAGTDASTTNSAKGGKNKRKAAGDNSGSVDQTISAVPVATTGPEDDVPIVVYAAVAAVIFLLMFGPPLVFLVFRRRE